MPYFRIIALNPLLFKNRTREVAYLNGRTYQLEGVPARRNPSTTPS